jgi:hypothetical protein
MPVDDIKLSRLAMRVLTQLRIDSTAVHVRSIRGYLYLNGRLQHPYTITITHVDVNYELLHEMDRLLRRLDDVKGIEYNLENWMHTGDGGWTKKRARF